MLEVLRSGRLSLGPLLRRVRAAFAARLGAPHASAVSSGTAGLHLALRAVGVSDGDEVITTPVLVRRLGQRGPLRAGPAGVRRHRPGTLTSTRRRPPRRRDRPHGGAAAGPYLRLARRTWRRSSASGCRSSRTPARRSARPTPTALPVGARGHPAVFGFYANKQLTTGEGGMVTLQRSGDQGATRIRAQPGPGADMDWLDHDRLGFNYRLSDIAARSAWPSCTAWTGCSRPRPGGRPVPRGAGRRRGPELPCPDSGRRRRGWFVYVVQLPRGRDRDATIARAGAARDPEQALFARRST